MTRDNAARDLNQEFSDNQHRQYAYDFDYRMHDYMLRTFKPYMPKGRALEMGCYHGGFTQLLVGIYDDVTVVEGASDLIAIAQPRVPQAKFVNSRFEDFASDEKFDAVFLMHTLEHLDDPISILSKIGTWLSPTGRLFIAVPNAHAASRQIAVGMGLISHASAVTEGERLHGHRCTYSIDTLKRDVQLAGLTIEDFGGVLFKPLANFQFDKALAQGIIGDDYLEGCYALGKIHPDLCASAYVVCGSHAAR